MTSHESACCYIGAFSAQSHLTTINCFIVLFGARKWYTPLDLHQSNRTGKNGKPKPFIPKWRYKLKSLLRLKGRKKMFCGLLKVCVNDVKYLQWMPMNGNDNGSISIHAINPFKWRNFNLKIIQARLFSHSVFRNEIKWIGRLPAIYPARTYFVWMHRTRKKEFRDASD